MVWFQVSDKMTDFLLEYVTRPITTLRAWVLLRESYRGKPLRDGVSSPEYCNTPYIVAECVHGFSNGTYVMVVMRNGRTRIPYSRSNRAARVHVEVGNVNLKLIV